jgi:hypothetical protein
LSEVAFVEDIFFIKVNLHALQLLQATGWQLIAKIAMFGNSILTIYWHIALVGNVILAINWHTYLFGNAVV